VRSCDRLDLASRKAYWKQRRILIRNMHVSRDLLVLRAGLVALTFVALAGCAHSLDKPRAAYAQGRLIEAESELRDLARESGASGEAARELLERVRRDRGVVASFLLDRAREALEVGDKQQALEAYGVALSLLDPADPAVRPTRAAIAELEEWHRATRAAFDASLAKLRLGQGTCSPGEQAELATRLGQQRQALGLAVSIIEPLLAAAQACYLTGRDLDVITLYQLAADVRLPGETLRPLGLAQLALAYSRLPDLPPASVEVAPVARQDPAPRRTRRTRPRDETPARAIEPDPTIVILANARREMSAGNADAAFKVLDAGLKEVAEPAQRETLRQQQVAWRGQRDQLIKTLIDQAEAALASERSDQAYALYRRVLELEPEHAVARDRIRRIETLRKMRGP
jgi:tetratricopeptide (TPR) repeat protein